MTTKILLLTHLIGLIYATHNDQFVTVTVNPATVSTQEKNIEFTCQYNGFTPPNEIGFLVWHFMTTDVYIYNSTGYQEIIDDNYKNRLNPKRLSNTTMVFTLSKAGLCDAGKYICRVFAKTPHLAEGSETLTKEDTPMKLNVHLGGIGDDSCVSCNQPEKKVITLGEGETSNIRCVAVNTPSPGPELIWKTLPTYNGTTVLYDYNDKERCIYGIVNERVIQMSTNMEDGVLFTCVAKFTDGTEWESESITIKGRKNDIAGGEVPGDGNTLPIVFIVCSTVVVIGLVVIVIIVLLKWSSGNGRDIPDENRNRRRSSLRRCSFNQDDDVEEKAGHDGENSNQEPSKSDEISLKKLEGVEDAPKTRFSSDPDNVPDHYANSEQHTPPDGAEDNETCALLKAEEGEDEVAKYLLDVYNVQPDVQDSNGRTALHKAVQDCQPAVVKLLVKWDNLIDLADENDQTPLHIAAVCELAGFREIVGILLDKGCDVDAVDNNGQTALHLVAANGATDSQNVMKMLLEKKCQVDTKDYISGQTAFHIAATFGSIEAVQLLVKHGCQQDLENKDGESGLELAESHNKTDVAEYLKSLMNK